MVVLTACLRFCECSGGARIPFEWAQEHCRSNSRIGNQVHFPHAVVQGEPNQRETILISALTPRAARQFFPEKSVDYQALTQNISEHKFTL